MIFLTSGIDDSWLLLMYCLISLQRVSLDCSNFHCWSDIVIGCAGPKFADDIALASRISSLAWWASLTPGWFSAIGCRDRASAAVLDQRPKFYGSSRRFRTYGYGGRSLRPFLRPKVLLVVFLVFYPKWRLKCVFHHTGAKIKLD